MVSIHYFILTMEIMEIYHKCSSDKRFPNIGQRFLDFSQLYTKNMFIQILLNYQGERTHF